MNAPVKPIKLLPLSARSSRPLAPSLERWRLRMYLLMLLADLLRIIGGFYLAGAAYQAAWPRKLLMMEAQLLLPVFATIAIQAFQKTPPRGFAPRDCKFRSA